MPLLPDIHSPADLRKIPVGRLPELAAEIRAKIIETVSANGGHLASNLGVVELTIALLYVFDPPEDKILFDVSHQAYAYKLLTGRADAFPTLRRTDGLSGFQKRSESPCDAFGAGHAGTAVSAALGLAAARDRRGGSEEVVAIVGDAAIANGVSLEALNNVRETTSRLLVVLNDNRMSIGVPTGALSRAFGRMLASPGYNRWKAAIEDYGIRRLRMSWLRGHYHALESRIKSLFTHRTNSVFETMGLRYVGPLDGHDIPRLIGAFRSLRGSKTPVVLHLATRKGRGYGPAERDPESWHSTPPFDAATGARAGRRPGTVAWSDAFGGALRRIARENRSVFALTAGMADGTGLSPFAAEFPDRFRDVGICEEHQATFAAGLAAGGMRPVVAVYSTFFQRALDGAVHDVALQNLPVLFAFDRAGAIPGDGPTHHGVFDLALLRPVPNFVLMQPRTPGDLERMMRTALALPGPSAIRYPRGSAPDAPDPDRASPLPVGRAAELSRTGPAPSVAIWTLGPEDAYADDLAARLRARGIDSVRVDARFAKPVDAELLARQAAEGVRVFFTFEDGIRAGGFGDAVRDALDALPSRPRLVSFGWPDEFLPHASSRDDLLARCRLTPADAAEAVLAALRA